MPRLLIPIQARNTSLILSLQTNHESADSPESDISISSASSRSESNASTENEVVRQYLLSHPWNNTQKTLRKVPLNRHMRNDNEYIVTMGSMQQGNDSAAMSPQSRAVHGTHSHDNAASPIVYLGSSQGRILVFDAQRLELLAITDLFQVQQQENGTGEAERHVTQDVVYGVYGSSTIHARRSLGGKTKQNPAMHHAIHTPKRHASTQASITNIQFYRVQGSDVAFVSLSNGSLYQIDAWTHEVTQRFEGLHLAGITCLAVYSGANGAHDTSIILPNHTSNLSTNHGASLGLFSPSPKRLSSGARHSPTSQHFYSSTNHLSHIESSPTHDLSTSDDTPPTYIITASDDGCVKFWRFNPESLTCFQTIDNLYAQDLLIVNTPGESAHDVSPESNLWIACEDASIHVWDIQNFKKKHILSEHTAAVNCLCQLENEIWSASKDQSICVWEANTGRLLKQISTGDTSVQYFIPVAKASVYRLWSINENASNHLSTQMWDAQNSFEFIVKMSLTSAMAQQAQRENAQLSESLNQSMEQSQMLKSVNEQLRHRVSYLEDSLRTIREDDMKQTQFVVELRETLQESEEKLQQSESDNATLRAELERLREEKQSLEQKESSLHSALQTIEKQRRSNEELEIRNRSLDERLSEYKEQVSALQHDLAHKTIALENLKDEMSAVVEDMRESKEKKFQLEAGTSYLEMQLNTGEAILLKLTRIMREVLLDEDAHNSSEEEQEEGYERVDYTFLRDNMAPFTQSVRKYQNLDKICLAYRQTLDDMLRELEETKRILLGEDEENPASDQQVRSLKDTFHAFSVALEGLSEHYLKSRQQARGTIESLQEELSQVTDELVQVNNELRDTTAKLEGEEKAHYIVDKLLKLAVTAALGNVHPDIPASTLEQKLNALSQIWNMHSEKQQKLISEVTVLDNTLNDMVELMNRFVESLPELDLNPAMFDQAESAALKSIIMELKRSSKFIGKSYSRQSIAEEIFFSPEEVTVPHEISNALKSGAHTPKPNKNGKAHQFGRNGTPSKSSNNIHFDGTIHTDMRRFSSSAQNSPKITKTPSATIIRHTLPSPHTRMDSPLKATVDVTPAEPSLEFKQHLLRLKVAENCLRIAHLYRQVEIAEELRFQDEKEVKRCTDEKLKLVEKDHYNSYIIKQTVEVLHHLLQVLVERSQVSIPAFTMVHNEEPHQKLLRTLEYMQKSMEKIILTLLERHEGCKTKLQAMKLRTLNASLKKSS